MPRARLGAVELEKGQLDDALSDLLAATNLDIGNAEARRWYGRAPSAALPWHRRRP